MSRTIRTLVGLALTAGLSVVGYAVPVLDTVGGTIESVAGGINNLSTNIVRLENRVIEYRTEIFEGTGLPTQPGFHQIWDRVNELPSASQLLSAPLPSHSGHSLEGALWGMWLDVEDVQSKVGSLPSAAQLLNAPLPSHSSFSLEDALWGMWLDVEDVQSKVGSLPSLSDMLAAPLHAPPGGEGQTLNRALWTVWTNTNQSLARLGEIKPEIDKIQGLQTKLVAVELDVDGIVQTVDQIAGNTGLLTTISTQAQKIPIIEAHVTALETLPSQMGSVVEDTQRLQMLVQNVEDAVDMQPTDVIDQLQNTVQDLEAALDFSADQLASAASHAGEHADPAVLLTNLETLINALGPRVGFNVDLSALKEYVKVIPQPLRTATGQALLTAGITQDFVEDIEQAALDVELLIRLIGPEFPSASGSGNGQGAGLPDTNIADRRFLTGGSGLTCAAVNEEAVRVTLVTARLGVIGLAVPLKIAGEVMQGISKTAFVPGLTTYLGTHGYIGTRIENDPYKMAGGITAGVADAMLAVADAAGGILNHCETLRYQQAILQATCRLNRFAGEVCPDWNGSYEQDALISGSALGFSLTPSVP